MFKNIEQIIFTKQIPKKEIAHKLGISYNTFLLKLKGNYPFTLDEALRVKEVLQTELSVEELFSKAA